MENVKLPLDREMENVFTLDSYRVYPVWRCLMHLGKSNLNLKRESYFSKLDRNLLSGVTVIYRKKKENVCVGILFCNSSTFGINNFH